MDDYISREAALDKLNMAYRLCTRYVERMPLEFGIGCVKGLPSADVEPVRHGEWERTDDDWNSLSTFRCSVCGEEWCFEIDEDLLTLNYNYCPNCGAKMDGGVESEL